jgi:hypothetical protein
MASESRKGNPPGKYSTAPLSRPLCLAENATILEVVEVVCELGGDDRCSEQHADFGVSFLASVPEVRRGDERDFPFDNDALRMET